MHDGLLTGSVQLGLHTDLFSGGSYVTPTTSCKPVSIDSPSSQRLFKRSPIPSPLPGGVGSKARSTADANELHVQHEEQQQQHGDDDGNREPSRQEEVEGHLPSSSTSLWQHAESVGQRIDHPQEHPKWTRSLAVEVARYQRRISDGRRLKARYLRYMNELAHVPRLPTNRDANGFVMMNLKQDELNQRDQERGRDLLEQIKQGQELQLPTPFSNRDAEYLRRSYQKNIKQIKRRLGRVYDESNMPVGHPSLQSYAESAAGSLTSLGHLYDDYEFGYKGIEKIEAEDREMWRQTHDFDVPEEEEEGGVGGRRRRRPLRDILASSSSHHQG